MESLGTEIRVDIRKLLAKYLFKTNLKFDKNIFKGNNDKL